MKRLFICCLLIACATLTMAQAAPGTFSIIPRVGVSISNISNNPLYIGNADYSLDAKAKAGFSVGADAYYQASRQIGVSAGVHYVSVGNKYDDYDVLTERPAEDATEAKYEAYTDLSNTLSYVAVPLMVHAYIAKGLSVNAGVQAGLLTHVKEEFTTCTFVQNIHTGVRTYNSDVTKAENTSDALYNKVDFSVPVGISYEYMNVVLDVRYNVGLTHVLKNSNSKNRSAMLTVGYKFDL